jgi:hypothetical protein
MNAYSGERDCSKCKCFLQPTTTELFITLVLHSVIQLIIESCHDQEGPPGPFRAAWAARFWHHVTFLLCPSHLHGSCENDSPDPVSKACLLRLQDGRVAADVPMVMGDGL